MASTLPDPCIPSWARLLDIPQAIVWCDRLPAEDLDLLTPAALLLLVRHVHAAGLALAERHWEPCGVTWPAEHTGAVLEEASLAFEALLAAVVCCREDICSVSSPPSRAVRAAAVCNRALEGLQLEGADREDVPAALMRLEASHAGVLQELYRPRNRQAIRRAQESLSSHVSPAEALEELLWGVGGLIWALERSVAAASRN